MIDQDIPIPDRNGLRSFALQIAAIVAVLFGLFFPWVFDARIPPWPWVFAAVFVVWGLAAPGSLALVYRLWMKLGLLLSKVTTPIVMGIAFTVTIIPVALILKLLGKDPMRRAVRTETASYRIESLPPVEEHLGRPF